jgi:hypothetical protein
VGPRAGLDGRKILPSTGIRSPDRPDRRQSLYRLSYPTHFPYSNQGDFITKGEMGGKFNKGPPARYSHFGNLVGRDHFWYLGLSL